MPPEVDIGLIVVAYSIDLIPNGMLPFSLAGALAGFSSDFSPVESESQPPDPAVRSPRVIVRTARRRWNMRTCPDNLREMGREPGTSASDPGPVEQFLREFIHLLNASGIGYVIPRNYEKLPFSYGKDFDLLVTPAHLARFREIALAVLHRQGFTAFPTYKDVRSVGVVGILNAADGTLKIGIDARAYVSFETSVLHRAIPGLSRKIFAHQIATVEREQDECRFLVPQSKDEWILLFKQWRTKPKDAYRRRLNQILDENPDLDRWVHDTVAPRSALFSEVSTSTWGEWMSKLLRSRWNTIPALDTAFETAQSIRTWSRGRRGGLAPAVYFSGPDGCGKTTCIAAVREFFDDNSIDYKSYYSYKKVLRYATRRLVWLKHQLRPNPELGPRSIAFIKIKPPSEEERDRNDGTASWRFRKYAALVVGVVDIHLGNALALVDRARGRVVLVETSPFDIFMKYHMPEFPRTERWLAPMIPRPTRGILLEAAPEAIHQRKPELSLAELEDYYERIARLLERAGVSDRYVAVSTEDDLSVTKRTLVKAVSEIL